MTMDVIRVTKSKYRMQENVSDSAVCHKAQMEVQISCGAPFLMAPKADGPGVGCWSTFCPSSFFHAFIHSINTHKLHHTFTTSFSTQDLQAIC